MIPAKIADYNKPGTPTASYNRTYEKYIACRNEGILAAGGSLASWIATGSAALAIRSLLVAFGMNSQKSVLVPVTVLQSTLDTIDAATLDWVSKLSLPLIAPPPEIVDLSRRQNLAEIIRDIYDLVAAPGTVTKSGGYVAASKVLHCLFPNFAPMIDGRHSGPSYYHIARDTYMAPLGLARWADWIGEDPPGVPNPSPSGAGRASWDWRRFLIAVGINQHIYELWRTDFDINDTGCFLALDPEPGTTGIPRLIDKVLW
ncbi:hypothetical protein LJR034_005291 [Caballeronia sp. LjRoot34]|uniref:hypothetical protein n=1 Tax=Caballeronia sp. LjRoot34 TaxID=3342325 RepID=UPI003ECEBFCE